MRQSRARIANMPGQGAARPLQVQGSALPAGGLHLNTPGQGAARPLRVQGSALPAGGL
ncbi:MAG: hypothetical protein RRY20_01350 [Bilophila sp.]